MKGKSLVAALLSLACASCATTGPDFAGLWSYRQECRFGHVANLELLQEDARISGSWDDGTRVRGESGLLKGTVEGTRARVWFCSETADDPKHACPSMGQEEAYLERVGDALVWYRGAQEYLTLHRNGEGVVIPVDDRDCAEDDE